jgi:filamentous hemagglutinin family protein
MVRESSFPQNSAQQHRPPKLSLALLLGGCLLTAAPAWAQTVQADGTNTTVGTGVTNCPGTCITGGINPGGGTLFHSFVEFGVANGATVTFQDPGGITNIIGRVTGTNPSVINGILRVADGSNQLTGTSLFLFNPNGVTFGDGATLQLGGSFIGSTASAVLFEDGTQFGINDTSATLSVSVPIGLQVGTGAGDITVNGAGNNLAVNPDTSLDQSNRPLGLQVGQQTLALVGNNVTLNGANLTANAGNSPSELQNNPGGRVEIGGVRSGVVSLTAVSDGWTLGYDRATLGNVTLTNDGTFDPFIGTPTNGSSINVSGSSVGTVRLQGAQVSFLNGSSIIANTLGAGNGGLVEVNATDLTFAGFSAEVTPAFAVDFTTSGIFANVDVGATGSGPQVNLNTTNLSVLDGAQVSTGTFGAGRTGQLNVNASNSISIAGGSPAGPSGLFASVQSGSTADNSGDLDLVINTASLSVTGGGQISVGSFGPGDAGNLEVNATNQVAVVGSFGAPPAGGPSSIRSASETGTAGAGGTVTVNTNRLLVADGGQIVSGTLSGSDAGDLVVRANQVELRGGDAFGRSGLIASALDTATGGVPNLTGTGSGGSIIVDATNLYIRDGATIRASNTPTGANPNVSPGRGPAGDIVIRAANVSLDNGSTVTADTVNGGNANIQITAQTLNVLDSSITTNATGTASGGNITANLVAMSLLGNSTVSANSVNSSGGRVSITTQSLTHSPTAVISATSARGPEFDGVVEINETQETSTETEGDAEAPEDSQEIITACERLTDNELVLAGAGGAPTDPTYGLSGQNLWADTRAATADTAPVVVAAPTVPEANPEPLVITPAQGWAFNDQGQLVLVAEVSGTDVGGDDLLVSHHPQYCGRT